MNAVTALFEDKIAAQPNNERQGFLVESKCNESGVSVPQISFCISATSGRHTGLDWARTYVTYPNSVRRLTPLECERLQGLPDHWTMPDKDYIVPIRGIETNRYHAVGNAVCVPVVQWIAGRISGILKSTAEEAGNLRKMAINRRLQHLAEKFLSPEVEVCELLSDVSEPKWKSGGIAYKNWVVTAPVSSSPAVAASSNLIDVIEKKDVHPRYFLSANAVQGILRRVDKQRRHLFPLDSVLRKIAAIDSESDVSTQKVLATPHIKELMAL